MRMLKKIMVLLVMCFPISHALAASPESPTVYTEDKTAIMVRANQPTFSIKFISNPTTGYSWYLLSYDSNLIQPVKQMYQPPANMKLIGAPGSELWTFRLKPAGFSVPMQTLIHFVYARPWEMSGQAKQVVFQVTTRPGESR